MWPERSGCGDRTPIESGIVRSAFRAPSNMREAVTEDTIWPINIFRFV